MKDRLCELQGVVVCKPPPDPEEARSHDDEDDDDDRPLEQQAVVFESEDAMQRIFREAQSTRKEIGLLRTDVKRLGKQNARFLTSVRRISSIKRDSNAIARDIRIRGEAIYARLERLGSQSKALEEEQGAGSAVARMVRSQCTALTNAFHRAMSEYNEAEMTQRENCKTRIQRQGEIMGKELSGDQIEEMIETGKWNVFAESPLLTTENRVARSALAEIEDRRRELVELEGRIRDIHDLFFQMALLVEEQGDMLDNIEKNVAATQHYVEQSVTKMKEAVRYKKKNPCRSLLCCCFPCCD